MRDSYSGGGVVLNDKGEVLLINEGGGYWGLPKGRIDPGEDVLTAAVREIQEETGLTELEYVTELGTYQRHPHNFGREDTTVLKHITMFLFRTCQEPPATNDEGNEARWMTLDQALETLTLSQDRDFLRGKCESIARHDATDAGSKPRA